MSLEVTVNYLTTRFKGVNFQALKQPLVVGISGPQGSGKSWLTGQLKPALEVALPKVRVVEFSMDDLYVTHEEQQKISREATETGDILLQGRGLPGTHDLSLAKDIFDRLKHRQSVSIPRYDKSAFGGEGDRAPECQWINVGPCDIILFEGWFNGFRASETIHLDYLTKGPDSVVQRHKMYEICELNSRLSEYEFIWNLFDEFVYLNTDNPQNVYRWRQQQEDALIEQKGSGMTEEQVVSFVDRYMPIYLLYYRNMCLVGSCTLGHNLEIIIGKDRTVLGHNVR